MVKKQSFRVEITTEYITLGNALKLAGIIATGGQSRSFLASNKIQVNGVSDNRRGRKLYPNDYFSVFINNCEQTYTIAYAD